MVLPRRSQREFVIERLDAEVLVYDVENHRAHCLNAASALVWGLCDGEHTAAEAARLLHERLSLPEDVELVHLALGSLQKAKLVEESEAIARVSRRDLARRLSLVGALAVLVPSVSSLVAPTAARADYHCAELGEACETSADCCPLLGVVVVCVTADGFSVCAVAEPED